MSLEYNIKEYNKISYPHINYESIRNFINEQTTKTPYSRDETVNNFINYLWQERNKNRLLSTETLIENYKKYEKITLSYNMSFTTLLGVFNFVEAER